RRSFHNLCCCQRELYAVPSAASCLGEEQIGARQFNNSCTFCYFSPLHTNLDRRSTEPTPFLGNFPDSTLSSPSRTANALILGLVERESPRVGQRRPGHVVRPTL